MSSTILVPLPVENFEDWCGYMATAFNNYDVPNPAPVENWREWVMQLYLSNPNLSNFPLPLISIYPNNEDWKKWAEFFINNSYTQK